MAKSMLFYAFVRIIKTLRLLAGEFIKSCAVRFNPRDFVAEGIANPKFESRFEFTVPFRAVTFCSVNVRTVSWAFEISLNTDSHMAHPHQPSTGVWGLLSNARKMRPTPEKYFVTREKL
jgi:hypothetical protein